MRDLPEKINVIYFSKFKQYREQRLLCRLYQQIYEFMLSEKFISGEESGFDLQGSQYTFSRGAIDAAQERLKTLGWETKLWRGNTMLFIYPPGKKPKILQYSTEY
jgi:hypothetical protein